MPSRRIYSEVTTVAPKMLKIDEALREGSSSEAESGSDEGQQRRGSTPSSDFLLSEFSHDLCKEMSMTRSVIRERLSQENVGAAARRDMEWELWILTGILDHHLPSEKLF